jgi:DinB superfamily
VEGVREEETRWRSAADQWSVLDCAEHVANVEHRILRTLQNAPAIPAEPVDAIRESGIYHRTCTRNTRVPAPEFVRPAGRYATLAEAVDAFLEKRNRAVEFLAAYNGDIRAIGATHPLLGPCNGYEYALIMAAHPIRHAGQVREIREAWRAR